jgi:bacterioferritin
MPIDEKRNQQIIDTLIAAYNAEIETVANYIANSVNLDGVAAKHIKNSLEADIAEELGHAQMLAKRIKTIGGVVPGSIALTMQQKALQPPADTTDVLSVIRGVIAAEESAIEGYMRVIEVSRDVDPATEDLAITLMADEQEHRREFIGYLKEYEKVQQSRV